MTLCALSVAIIAVGAMLTCSACTNGGDSPPPVSNTPPPIALKLEPINRAFSRCRNVGHWVRAERDRRALLSLPCNRFRRQSQDPHRKKHVLSNKVWSFCPAGHESPSFSGPLIVQPLPCASAYVGTLLDNV